MIAGLVVGAVGGTVIWALGLASFVTGAVLGGLYGLLFALLVARRAASLGGGLLWGLGYAFLLWLAGPTGLFSLLDGADGAPAMGMLDTARAHFPELVGYLLCFGLPLGMTMGALGSLRPGQSPGQSRFSLQRALVVGGAAGIVGGWAFGKWMAQVGFFPIIAGLVGSDSPTVGMALHFAIAVFIGASFGVLFQRDVRSLGSSLGWGLAYGFLWWFLGPLTLLPILQGSAPDWSYEQGGALFGSLVGHVMYGLLLGLVYAALNRLWVGFFYASDPINREVEGPGKRTLRSLGWGALASLAGGLLFSLIMVATGVLPMI
ncbi:MAG: DUF1440 domain-containing protein, partial [Actinobacteria bacterium]|nr:DUF1440 domain-containing protein [Actinomycetota bacterium]